VPIGLRPGVSFCEASGHLVFLDVTADRYFGLGDTAEAAFRRCLGAAASACKAAELGALIASGLVVEAPDVAPMQPCTPPPVPRASLLDQTLPPAKPLRVVRAIAGLVRTRLQLRAGGLASVVRSVAVRKQGLRDAPGSASEIRNATAIYRASSLFVRSHDQCLVRAVTLTRHLARRGESVSLVIGVHVRPFSAHAWVQFGDLLLNETCDGVRAYTPILVL
jgi:hypothetical protein